MRTRIAGAITVCLSSDPPRSTLSRARTVVCLGQAVPPGNSPSGPLAIANRFALSYASRVGGSGFSRGPCVGESGDGLQGKTETR